MPLNLRVLSEPNIDYVMGFGLIQDIPNPHLASVYEFAELITNTGKPIIAWAREPSNVAAMHRMALAVAGREEALRARPIFVLFSTYPSPLRHTDEDLANVMWAARHGIPVVYLCADIGSLPMLVLVDEIVGMARRIMRGVEVNASTIMLDLIERVGPGGHFLEEPESAALSRKEVWMPTVLDRNQHVLWEQAGSRDTSQRVHDKLCKILAKHRPPALSESAQAEITKILLEETTRAGEPK